MAGLRERKKLETRQHIADVAGRLFAEHGYVAVTVEQVAQAADVATKTVFNYFPAKEDLVFDQAAARELELVAMVRDLPPGESLLGAFRARAVRLLDFIGERKPGFQRGSPFELARTEPALQRRGLELAEQLARAVAATIATRQGRPPDDPEASVVARMLLAAYRSVFLEVHARLDAGAMPREAADAARPVIDRVFDVVATGLADYPGRPDAEPPVSRARRPAGRS